MTSPHPALITHSTTSRQGIEDQRSELLACFDEGAPFEVVEQRTSHTCRVSIASKAPCLKVAFLEPHIACHFLGSLSSSPVVRLRCAIDRGCLLQEVEGSLEAHLSFAVPRQPWQCAASAQRSDPSAQGSSGASGAPAIIRAGLTIISVML